MSEAVRWLACRSAEVPPGDEWLSEAERAVQSGLRFERRRASWRLGRWTAKQALLRALDVGGPAQITILASEDGAPEAYLDGARVPLVLTISHRGDVGVAALGARPVGADLESIETREASFVDTFFTEPERAAAAANPAHRDLVVALMWSAKESALKLRRTGLRRDTRSMQVEVDAGVEPGAGWARLTVEDLEQPAVWAGWWRRFGRLVLTMVGETDHEPSALGAERRFPA